MMETNEGGQSGEHVVSSGSSPLYGGRLTGGDSDRSAAMEGHQGTNKKNVVDFQIPPQDGDDHDDDDDDEDKPLKVYWQRWIMLMYMSFLNLLSDWTCYSVAPIAVLTEEAFGNIDSELLVVVFLGANGIATALEPIILSRLGLRRTVLFGAMLLMIGSIVKSGGMPPIIQANIEKGSGEWRVYLGFFLVGLSQPLYQCTPALLSASWFPESERTVATGVALNANQLGIGFAFIFGTLLVGTSDDIPSYFGLLSIISTLTFLGTLFQFDDAPPTPPSASAKVMRGTLEVRLPTVQSIVDSVRNLGSNLDRGAGLAVPDASSHASQDIAVGKSSSTAESTASASGSSSLGRAVAPAPSCALPGPVVAPRSRGQGAAGALEEVYPAPSPMMPGGVGQGHQPGAVNGHQQGEGFPPQQQQEGNVHHPGGEHGQPPHGEDAHQFNQFPPMQQHPGYPTAGPWPVAGGYPMPPVPPPGMPPYPGGPPAGQHEAPLQPPPPPGYPQYPYPVWNPQVGQYVYAYPPPQQQPIYPPPHPGHAYYGYQHPPAAEDYQRSQALAVLPTPEAIDVGAEPVLTLTPHHLDINIRDDQVFRSINACLARPGFVHSLVAFTVSGIVINTLSTFMDYLVRLNGVGREYTGIVGGSFQFVIMISSLIVGQICDRTRAYYTVTVGMLVVGAFGLAECGVSLDADKGTQLRLSLIVVAALVGPLQPVSTELGVDVVYPLSENTVLVIQQLFSNMLSACFIPIFKMLKEIGVKEEVVNGVVHKKPEYTFSFYLLIVLHAAATVFFATFNGRYLRYEHELEKKASEEQRRAEKAAARGSGSGTGASAAHPLTGEEEHYRNNYGSTEDQPLIAQTTA